MHLTETSEICRCGPHTAAWVAVALEPAHWVASNKAHLCLHSPSSGNYACQGVEAVVWVNGCLKTQGTELSGTEGPCQFYVLKSG